jgi:hypothetical protein
MVEKLVRRGRLPKDRAARVGRDEASARARGARAPPTAVEYVKPPWSPTYGCQVLYLDKRL